MRDELAGRLLDSLLEWEPEEQSEWVRDLRRLAVLKYDDYEGFSAGERFLESFARWIEQFEDQDARRRLLQFVRRELVFISRAELNHAIACVYPDFLKRDLVRKVARELDESEFNLPVVIGSRRFRSMRRKTLYLGLSDGARLDRLRRASPELSHEQFWLSPELGPHAVATMAEKLSEAISETDLDEGAQFEHVVLVDDFYGSGTSLLDTKEGDWKGKLVRARKHMNDQLVVGENPLLGPNAQATVVIYVASSQAEQHIRNCLASFEPGWDLHVVQRLPDSLRVDDPVMLQICDGFFDDVLVDRYKGPAARGYKNAALPLVLHHNTPNNSISPLWADSTDRGGKDRRALFPRYERHHVDRP